jgi:hypothetical protein
MSDADLTLPEPDTEEVTVVLAGLAVIQMQALGAGDLEKVTAAGNSMAKFAEANPEQVRETLLENNQAFHVAAMPDEMLDHLDLEVRDGTLYENTDDDGWTEVEIDG